jgi:hypothetical protein
LEIFYYERFKNKKNEIFNTFLKLKQFVVMDKNIFFNNMKKEYCISEFIKTCVHRKSPLIGAFISFYN